MKRGSSAKRLLASILGKNAPNSSSSTEVKIADEEENAETAPNMSGGSLKDIRERVSRARGKHGLSRLHSRELEVGGVCLSPKMNIPSLSDDKMERLLKEARLLALKYSKEDIVESHGGFLCKAPEGRRLSFMTATPYRRWFRLVYNKAVCEWHLRWYTDEWQEELVNECSLSGAKVTVVKDQRAAPVSREYRDSCKDTVPTALCIASLNKKVRKYRLFTTTLERSNPDDGAKVLQRIVSIVHTGADKPEIPTRKDVIQALFEESLDRNNIKASTRDAMKKRLSTIGQWDYVVHSSVSDRDVRCEMESTLAKIRQWVEDLTPLSAAKSSTERCSLCWTKISEQAAHIVSSLSAMPKGLGRWLDMFAESDGMSLLSALLEQFLNIARMDPLRHEERIALKAVVSIFVWMSKDQRGSKMLESAHEDLKKMVPSLISILRGEAKRAGPPTDLVDFISSLEFAVDNVAEKKVSSKICIIEDYLSSTSISPGASISKPTTPPPPPPPGA